MTRVFLIASSERERDRLEDLLEAAEAEVVGRAVDPESAGEELLETAEVVLLDASAEAPEELLETLQAQEFLRNARVTLLTGQRSFLWTNQAIRAGVRGILPLDLSAAQLATALDAVAQGFVVVHPSELQLQGAAGGTNETLDFVEALTAREREVLHMLAQGRGNKDIAARLNISEHTVKFHVASILGKLGAATRTEAVSLAVRRGLILL